ncbi:MAG TPA: hypothetical protein VF546_23345 [Pyrinomonadaceae bacterium]
MNKSIRRYMRQLTSVAIYLHLLRVAAADRAHQVTSADICCHLLRAQFGHNAMPRLEEIVDTNRLERAADGHAPFEVNPFMERLIEMRTQRPKSFDGLSPTAKLSLGYYEAAKRRAAMLEGE